MKWVALIYAAEWISVGLAVSTAIRTDRYGCGKSSGG